MAADIPKRYYPPKSNQKLRDDFEKFLKDPPSPSGTTTKGRHHIPAWEFERAHPGVIGIHYKWKMPENEDPIITEADFIHKFVHTDNIRARAEKLDDSAPPGLSDYVKTVIERIESDNLKLCRTIFEGIKKENSSFDPPLAGLETYIIDNDIEQWRALILGCTSYYNYSDIAFFLEDMATGGAKVRDTVYQERLGEVLSLAQQSSLGWIPSLETLTNIKEQLSHLKSGPSTGVDDPSGTGMQGPGTDTPGRTS